MGYSDVPRVDPRDDTRVIVKYSHLLICIVVVDIFACDVGQGQFETVFGQWTVMQLQHWRFIT